MTTEPRDELADVRSKLRETWPSLTDDDVAQLPRSRKEAAASLQRHTGADLDEIETTLSDLYGMVPERHTPGAPEDDET